MVKDGSNIFAKQISKVGFRSSASALFAVFLKRPVYALFTLCLRLRFVSQFKNIIKAILFLSWEEMATCLVGAVPSAPTTAWQVTTSKGHLA